MIGEGGVALPPSTPPDMRAASGGSSSRRIETLPGLGEGQQAEAVPVGIGQGHLKDPGASNPPLSLAAISPFTGAALGDTAYPQVVPPGAVLFHSFQRTCRIRRLPAGLCCWLLRLELGGCLGRRLVDHRLLLGSRLLLLSRGRLLLLLSRLLLPMRPGRWCCPL